MVASSGTSSRFYSLLRRQILFSVIARQSPDGGWCHGEWTDFMESHFRFHNAAMLLMEAALEETKDKVVREALDSAASFISRRTDRTDIGLWFLHDSLEQSVEICIAVLLYTKPILASRREQADLISTSMNSDRCSGSLPERCWCHTGTEHLDSAAYTPELACSRPAEWLYRLILAVG